MTYGNQLSHYRAEWSYLSDSRLVSQSTQVHAINVRDGRMERLSLIQNQIWPTWPLRYGIRFPDMGGLAQMILLLPCISSLPKLAYCVRQNMKALDCCIMS